MKRRSLPRRLSISKQREFLNIRATGKKAFSRNLVFFAKNIQAETEGRLGITISKKNCRQANKRNKLRRQIREIIRQHPNFPFDFDLVVVVRNGLETQTYDEIKLQVYKNIKGFISNKAS